MNPTAGLKWSAAFFGVFWTIGMVWWSGSLDPAYIVVTAIGGSIAGYGWYLAMRWILILRHVPSKASPCWLARSMPICRRGDIAGK